MQFIDLKTQQNRISRNIEDAISRVLKHGQYIMGPEVQELESKLEVFTGSSNCISCSSGTDALLLTLLAYNVGPGDAIITTPFTFFATAEVIALCGATPVFVDIDSESYNICPHKIKKTIQTYESNNRDKLKGIITVDLFGCPADYDAIMPMADEYNLFVIQDSSQAFGATYKNRQAPTHGHVGTTSFFPAKPLGCYGDGGAVFTDDNRLANKIRSLRVHGKGSDKYNNVNIGINGRLDTLQAAILLEKFKIYPKEIEKRNHIANDYQDRLSSFKLQYVSGAVTSVWAQFVIESDCRDELMMRLQSFDIPSFIYYPKPLHLLDAMKKYGYQRGDFSVAESVSEKIFALPMHAYLSTHEVDYICRKLVNEMS